jgi:hypothetical protein
MEGFPDRPQIFQRQSPGSLVQNATPGAKLRALMAQPRCCRS